jgi:hypothetical protein
MAELYRVLCIAGPEDAEAIGLDADEDAQENWTSL